MKTPIKETKMMKRITISAGLIFLFVMGAFADNGPARSKSGNSSRKLAIGSWSVIGETALQGTFYALITFHSDGTVIADEPSAFETAGHGTWTELGRNEVGYTFVSLIGSSSGAWTGSIKVTGSLRVDGSRGQWIGPFNVYVFDATGNVIFSDSGTLKGNAIKVEP